MHFLVDLARKSLAHYFETGLVLPLPDGPSEFAQGRAGVFVTLTQAGQLRGCIGTIAPTRENILQETIYNALSAALKDPRFPPVRKAEWPSLTFEVSVLHAPEPIQSTDQLDPKQYGVIVTSGHHRGLLLPDLEGIDTIEEQVTHAKYKAGLSANATVELQRFKVDKFT